MRCAAILLLLACSEPAPVVQHEPIAPVEPEAPAEPEAPPPEPEPPPEPPPPEPPQPAFTRCTIDRDCALVTGGCAGPASAHLSEAARIDAENQARLSATECASGESPPVRPFCGGNTGEIAHCVTLALDHPEWRTCARDRDCALEFRDCQHWEGINTRSVDAAHAEFTSMGVCPGIVPQMPEVRCRYGFCAAPWGGE